ncbi:MAG TPA: hypothetical protein V6C72_10765 [Chroococcales cyanobacterium]
MVHPFDWVMEPAIIRTQHYKPTEAIDERDTAGYLPDDTVSMTACISEVSEPDILLVLVLVSTDIAYRLDNAKLRHGIN